MIWQNAIKKQQLLQQQKNIGYSFNGRDMEHTRSKGFKKLKTGRLYFFFLLIVYIVQLHTLSVGLHVFYCKV